MFLQMMCNHISALMQVQQQGFNYRFILTPFHFIYLSTIFLQHFIFILKYHILQSHIFHDVSVVIPSMIQVSICYVAHVGMSALQLMIRFEIPLEPSNYIFTPIQDICNLQGLIFSNLGLLNVYISLKTICDCYYFLNEGHWISIIKGISTTHKRGKIFKS